MRVMPTIFVNVLVLALAFGNACADDNNKDAVEVVDDAKADTPDSPGDEDVQLGQDDSVQPVGEWGKFFDKRDWSDDGKRRVVILHTNDLHSFVSGLGPLADYSPDAENEDGTIGGFARIASLIDRERNDPRPSSSVLVVDAGDFTFGTAYAYLARTLGLELKLMEALGFDATTFGNHEMDWGPAGTASVVEAGLTSDSKLKIVASNLVFDEEDPADDVLAALMGTKVLPHHTITMDNGIKVGIFGLLGTNALKLAPHAAPVTVASPAKAAQEVVDHLRDVEKCDFIVGLSHGGVGEGDIPGEDEEIAGRLKNVDVLITGHSHTLMKEAKMYGTTLVVQAGNYGQHLGNLVMVETEDGFELESWETILVDDSIPGKPEILGIVAEAEAQLADTMFKGLGYGYNTPIATTDFDLPTVEFSESGLGDFVADAVRAVTNKYDPKGPIQVVFEANGVIRDGIELVLACDIVYASENAIFGQPEVKLGVVPGFGGTARLVRVIGRNNALEWILMGDNVSAADAYRVGLVQKVVPQEELMQVAMAAAHRLAGLGPLAVRTARSLVKKAQELPLEQALEAEATAFAGLFKGHDQKEGMQAFLQRRKPEFKGN